MDPELLEFYLSALFNLLLEFSGFLVFAFDGGSCAGVLELDLALHRPPFAEVIADIYHSMGNVEAAMAGCIPVVVGLCVDVGRIVIEVPCHGHFPVASHCKHAVLCIGCQTT